MHRNEIFIEAEIVLPVQHERFHSAPASLVGTAEYLSPEVIRSAGKKAYNGRVGSSENALAVQAAGSDMIEENIASS